MQTVPEARPKESAKGSRQVRQQTNEQSRQPTNAPAARVGVVQTRKQTFQPHLATLLDVQSCKPGRPPSNPHDETPPIPPSLQYSRIESGKWTVEQMTRTPDVRQFVCHS
ncbi:hypothetical protein BKA80DRAFT_58725 [Phyllosticta citrichinensis]